MVMVNFKNLGLDRYDVLCVLYNNSHPLGFGILQYEPGPLTKEQAKEILDGCDGYVDYLKGRVIKVNLPKDAEEFNPYLYDRDNGEGAAKMVIEEYATRKMENK